MKMAYGFTSYEAKNYTLAVKLEPNLSAVSFARRDSNWAGMAFVMVTEACYSILTFLSDVFDLGNSTLGEQYKSVRDNVVVPRGPSLTRILIASLTGALPRSRLDAVTRTLLSLTRAYGIKSLEWAKQSISLIPLAAVTEVEKSRFLQSLSEAASGADISELTVPVEELSDVCRRNRAVQEIVHLSLRPLELNLAPVL